MNKKAIFVCALTAAAICVCGLAACGQQATSSGSDTSSNTASLQSSSVDLASTQTLAECMGAYYASFHEFDEGIQSGKSVPPTMRFRAKGSVDGEIHDQDVIQRVWKKLCEIRVSKKKVENHPNDDPTTTFDFDSGSESIPFYFCNTSFIHVVGNEVYEVQDASEVLALVEELSSTLKSSEPMGNDSSAGAGSELKEEKGAYFWDTDGDGSKEHMWIDFNNNGDEAPSGMQIRIFGSSFDTSAYLDGAYAINSVKLEKDERGPYVTLDYDQGDYYSHDHAARCAIRVVDGKIEIKELQV